MMFKFYKCLKCGQVVAKVKATGCTPVCCGQEMMELNPNTEDAAAEKHVPVVEVEGNIVTVKVGDVPHPMVEDHYISPIMIETSEGIQFKELKPGDAPEAKFVLADGEKLIAAYEYCNKHNLWKAEV
jgi:superoxide reductase